MQTPSHSRSRTLVAVLLLALASPALAEWVRIYEDEGTVGYIDPTTVRNVDGNVRRVHELLDFKVPDPQFKGERSHRFVVDYDCKKKLVSIVSVAGYSERMAKGRLTNAAEPKPNWNQIGPGSHHVRQLRMVCGG